MGNRIAKHIFTDNAFTLLEKSTYYVRDASGNVMAVYDRIMNESEETGGFTLSERHIYGSSRIGMDVTSYEFVSTIYTESNETQHELGHKHYEISNYLGNVMVVVSDRKLAMDSDNDGTIDYYTADVRSAQDYYLGGMIMPGRSFNSTDYRFGAFGFEKDDEIKGSGNHYSFSDYGFDPRIIRRWRPDPKATLLPHISPYAFALNNFINVVDPDGEFPILINGEVGQFGRFGSGNAKDRGSSSYWSPNILSTITKQQVTHNQHLSL